MNFLRRRRASDSDEEDNDVSRGNTLKIHKSRRPPNTAFRQQRLKAWQPLLTPKSVIPFLFLLAVIFAPLGIAMLNTIYNVQLLQIDYTKCDKLAKSHYESVPLKYVHHHFKHKNTDPELKWKVTSEKDSFGDEVKTCYFQFNIPVDIKPPLYLYYQLTNFFQNHRKYVESYDLEQLKGIAVTSDDLADGCKPLKHSGDKIIYPCGLIANSYFNDTINSPTLLNTKDGNSNSTYKLSPKGISWSSDRNGKYKKTSYDPKDIAPPPNWYKMFPKGYNESNLPDLSKWEHLQNWMRTAGLASFYKLYGKNETETLSSGTYEMLIELNYPVSIFGGTKSVVLTTNSIFGGRNMSLGVIYIIVAIVCLVLAISFLLLHLIKPRRIGDHNYLQNSSGIYNSRDSTRLGAGPTQLRDQL